MANHKLPDPVFQPLRPESRRRLIAACLVGPLLWLVAIVVVGLISRRTQAVLVGLAVALASMVVAVLVLAVLRWRRLKEEGTAAAPR